MLHEVGDLLLSRSSQDPCLGQIAKINYTEGIGYCYSIYWFTGCRDRLSAGYSSGEIWAFKESLGRYVDGRL